MLLQNLSILYSFFKGANHRFGDQAEYHLIFFGILSRAVVPFSQHQILKISHVHPHLVMQIRGNNME